MWAAGTHCRGHSRVVGRQAARAKSGLSAGQLFDDGDLLVHVIVCGCEIDLIGSRKSIPDLVADSG